MNLSGFWVYPLDWKTNFTFWIHRVLCDLHLIILKGFNVSENYITWQFTKWIMVIYKFNISFIQIVNSQGDLTYRLNFFILWNSHCVSMFNANYIYYCASHCKFIKSCIGNVLIQTEFTMWINIMLNSFVIQI